MIGPLEVIQWGFTGWVTWSCLVYLKSGEWRDDYKIFLGHSVLDWLKLVASAMCVLAFTITIVVTLYAYGPSALRWSWLNLLTDPKKEPSPTNLNLAGASIPYFGVFFLLMLFLNLPRLARREEEMFREGTKDWKDAIPRSLKFGLIHCVVGVPIGLGLCLAIPGMWFTHQYFRGGVDKATLYHAVNNMLVVGFILTVMILGKLLPHSF